MILNQSEFKTICLNFFLNATFTDRNMKIFKLKRNILKKPDRELTNITKLLKPKDLKMNT